MTDSHRFSREDLKRADRRLLRDGRLFNARVDLVNMDGVLWTFKDFSSRPWFVRIIAQLLLWREQKALERLKHIDGFAPDVFRLDRNSLAVRFIEGRPLTRVPKEDITPEFLTDLESLTRKMHQAGIVHLDIRSLSNVVMRPDGRAAIIDPQAAMCTENMPNWLRRALEDIDISGAYKKWQKFCPDQMGEERRKELARINRFRRFWIFRGY